MQKIYNFFLHRYLTAEHTKFLKVRLILHFCLITALFSLFYVAIATFIQFSASIGVMTTLVFLFSGLALMLRSPVSPWIIAQLYLLLSFIAAIVLIYYSGMMYSSIVPWLAFIPLAANLLIGRKAALFWLAISCLFVFSLIYFTPPRESVAIQYNLKYDIYFFAFVYNGLTAIVLVLSIAFQSSNNVYLSQLKEKNDLISKINEELKSKNDEISSQNEELREQKEEILSQRAFIETKNDRLLEVQDELNDIIEKLTYTQTTLDQREAENRSILDAIYNTQLLVAELDLEGRILKMSSTTKKFLQITSETYKGKMFQEIWGSVNFNFETSANFSEIWQNIIDGRHSDHHVSIEINGEKRWLKEHFFPILNEEGSPIKIMVIAQDITQLVDQKDKIELLNTDLKQKILEIERQNSLLIAQRKEIEKINEEIRNVNSSLEARVFERTKILEEKNKQLAEYAYINAHLLRGPLCSILGLVNLMEINNDDDHGLVIHHMKKSTVELHDVVGKITKAIEAGAHFDRNLLSNN